MAGTLEMDVVVLRCGDGQEMREGELRVCGLVKLVERYRHVSLDTITTP
jgi:hypothetical protein